jgi:hypothetical protein
VKRIEKITYVVQEKLNEPSKNAEKRNEGGRNHNQMTSYEKEISVSDILR